MDTQFGKRLAHARAARNLTQRELAEVVGITWSQISRYEAGKAKPRLAVLMKLAEVLGVDADQLSGDQAEEEGREITLNLTGREEARIEEFANANGLSFDEAVNQIIAAGLKTRLEGNLDMLAQLEEDVPGAYEKLVELLKKQ
ncbi:helix-turn-helix domain-containing protein [Pseudomonas sichuanensis]|uniref:helix-turn-helix domain-containing protein n=1 Tax=Pseudomonas sichuanensis TaxID=2213015 RepID=UPI002447BCE3|nr:helix-turn-helix transcriptional regulator [Pseudomonas sichuanensis]MDH0730962.1 helix-turn-helix domain-containing protein [Pseudomonas sichuanensis]MDH1581061.1 helix-turn-helix domain-containing protein [Pseudomonas sichuanensis]MDH1591078.1 helix-turn-helix domain-containing protein [Pseudomonas sichuanensis]MDH1596747.1 helix-turn-helix domain-containing protein [Pseudomonas sichuanensis]